MYLREVVDFLKQEGIHLSALSETPEPSDPKSARFYEPEHRMKYMDKFGIDSQLVSMGQIGASWSGISDSNLLKITRIANESLARVVEKNRERMMGVATMLNLEGEFLDEVDRCIEQLGMKGCLIYSNFFGKPIDSPEFLPFFEKIAGHKVPIFLHPTSWSYYYWIEEYRIDRMLGWPFDTSVAMSRLVFGGVLERFPELKVVVHHLGGMIPFYSQRIAGVSRGHDKTRQNLSKPALEYFKMFYADTVVGGNSEALRCGLEFFGTDHVVFATDYPYGPGSGEEYTSSTIDMIRKAGLSEEIQEKIFGNNIVQLLRI